MDSERRRGLAFIFLIIGLISLVPVGYAIYLNINYFHEIHTIAEKAWAVVAFIMLWAFPVSFIIPSLAIIIKDRRLRNLWRVYERSREPQPENQPVKPKRDWTVFKIWGSISLVLIVIGTVIILSDREKKAMSIEVEGTVVAERKAGKKHFYTVEFNLDGKSETHELQGRAPLFRKTMMLYVSKDTYDSIFGDGDDRHFILHYQNKSLLWIILSFGSAAFIIFGVLLMTFGKNVEPPKNNGMADVGIE